MVGRRNARKCSSRKAASHGRPDREQKVLGIFQSLELRSRFGDFGNRQPVALRDVEDGVRPQERNGSDTVLRALVVPFEDRIEKDRRPMLAFAHVSAQVKRLAKREPLGSRVRLDRLGHPKRDDVRAAVRAMRESICGHPALRPWTHPRGAACLKLRDDAVRDRDVFFETRRSSGTCART
jgi:hypothetical protein